MPKISLICYKTLLLSTIYFFLVFVTNVKVKMKKYFKEEESIEILKIIGLIAFRLVSAIFIKFLFFHQMVALQRLWKMLFISSKKLFPFLRYSNFCAFVFLLFLPVRHGFRGWSKINFKVYDAINCLNKNLVTHFVQYLDKKKKYDIETLSIHGVKIMQKMCTKR